MDFQGLLFNPSFAIYGVPAILAFGGFRSDVTVIDKTSGVDIGDGGVHGQTIAPACVIRAPEVLGLGVQIEALGGDNVTVNFNGVWWKVESYRMKPSPLGELDGEIYLILSKAPILLVSTLTIPPPDFRDDLGMLPPTLLVFWDFGLLGMDIDPDFLDEAGLDALPTITTLLAAAIADDLGLSAQLRVSSGLVASFADDLGLSVIFGVATFLSATFTDEGTFTAIETHDFNAAFVDDLGFVAVLGAFTILSASIADDTGLAATLDVLTSLAAALADDVGLAATITPAWQLAAALADDVGLAATITAGVYLTAAFADDLGVSAAALAAPPIVFAAVNGSPASTSGVQTAAPAGIVAGNLLISVCLVPNQDTGGFSTSSGWTIVAQVHNANYSKAIAVRIANGATADQITWFWTNSAIPCYSNFSRYTGGAKSVGNASVNSGTGTSATPTAITSAKGGSFMQDVTGVSGTQPAAPSGWTGSFGGGAPNPAEEMSIKAVPQAGTSSGAAASTVPSGNWCVIAYEVGTLN